MKAAWFLTPYLTVLLAATSAQATTVTYTFTEFDGNAVVWQFRHSLDHFLDASTSETRSFDLSDLVVDPWVAMGHHTVQLDNQGFSGLPGFITFNGAYFCNEADPNPASCDPGHQTFAVSFDMNVTDGIAGSWTAGNNRVDVVVDDQVPPSRDLPEPSTVALLALALLTSRLTRYVDRK